MRFFCDHNHGEKPYEGNSDEDGIWCPENPDGWHKWLKWSVSYEQETVIVVEQRPGISSMVQLVVSSDAYYRFSEIVTVDTLECTNCGEIETRSPSRLLGVVIRR